MSRMPLHWHGTITHDASPQSRQLYAVPRISQVCSKAVKVTIDVVAVLGYPSRGDNPSKA